MFTINNLTQKLVKYLNASGLKWSRMARKG